MSVVVDLSARCYRRGLLTVVAVLVLLSGLLGVLGASSARAAGSPWWHLTTLSQPSYLQEGQAKNEIQEVRLSSEEGLYVLIEPEHANNSALISANEPLTEIQHQLESEVYGAGNVKVSAAQGAPGGRAYKITFVKGLGDQSVALVQARVIEGAQVFVGEATRGRPDGVIVVNAVNLGDAVVDPALAPVTVADTLPAGVKPVAIEGVVEESPYAGHGEGADKLKCSLTEASCIYTGAPPAGEKKANAGEEKFYAERYPSALAPYQAIQVRIAVKLSGASQGSVNAASVTGGGAPPMHVQRGLTIGSSPTPFGVSAYEMDLEEPGGKPPTQAGSHPFQMTTTVMLNETIEGKPIALAKDLHFKLPPGLIGNPDPFPRCTLSQFLTDNGEFTRNECPPQTAVGMARVYVDVETPEETQIAGELTTPMVPFTAPVFNLEPETGEPARFGFVVVGGGEFVPVILDTSVRTGGDYGVTVTVRNISQEAAFLGSEVTFWGVPGDPSHDDSRGSECMFTSLFETTHELSNSRCLPLEAHNPPPLLSLPTSCTGSLLTSMEADSWADPGVFGSALPVESLPAMDGCNRAPFTPSIRITPDGTEASKPTGLNVDVHVPQELTLNPTGLAESEVRAVTVALPEGVAIDPAGGDGLEACPESLVGFSGFGESPLEPGVDNPLFTPVLPGSSKSSEPLLPGVNFCANASKIGTVTIRTPLLPNALEGDVYLAAQEANPFDSLVAMYIVAEDPISGTVVKLPGVVHLTPTGQVVATFEDTPQLPFQDAELHFFGGERAPLTSPARCGNYTTQAWFTPWSGAGTVQSTASFQVKTGPNGAPCPGAGLPFDPSLTAGTTSIQAGGFSPFTMTMSREDGEQQLQAISLHMPPGVSGLLTGVELCPEPQADQGTCGPGSLIGETTVGVGVGGDPFTVKGGKVYLTGPYKGAPFGLSIVNPAKAGPFDLEKTAANHPACDCLVVRATIQVNPITAQLTVTSDNEGPYKIPTILEGIPLQIKHVNVTINRPSFTFNPTNCEPMSITGTLSSAEGGSSNLAVPFQATNCAVLGFKPLFSVSTNGKTSRRDGASLKVKLTYPNVPFDARSNIKSVKVDLPKQLPSNLKTLQRACPHQVFETNPASCPSASKVGSAKAITPLIPVPLEGPAYFVSYGGAKFPELVIVLQGYGVTLDLHGETFINEHTNITSSTFHTIPDAPVGSFELNLPQGPYSALAANTNLCTIKGGLKMPTIFTAQNGTTVKQNTPVTTTGCPKAHHTAKRKVKHKKKK